MTHRAVIERNSADVADRYAVPGWATFIAAQPCFLYVSGGREVVAPDRTADVDVSKMIVPLGADIENTDRINGVADRLGNPVFAGLLNITDVLPHHDHIELTLERVTGGA